MLQNKQCLKVLPTNSDFTDLMKIKSFAHNLNLKQDKYSIQAVNLDENDSESVKVYFTPDILIVYFTLIDNKTIDSYQRAYFYGKYLDYKCYILDTNLIDDTTFINIRNKITDSFVKRNFKKKDITFLEQFA